MTALASTICSFVDANYKAPTADKLALLELGYNVQRRPDNILNYIKAAKFKDRNLTTELAARVIMVQSESGKPMLIEDLTLFPAGVWLSAILAVRDSPHLARPSITQTMSISEMVGNRTGVVDRLPCALLGGPRLLSNETILKKLKDGRTSFRGSDMIDMEACSKSRVSEFMKRIKHLGTVLDAKGNLELLCAAAVLKKDYRLSPAVPDDTKEKFVGFARELGIQHDILDNGPTETFNEARSS